MVACWAPNHYLNQCWIIVSWTLGNKLQWNFNQNNIIFFEEIAFETSSAKWLPFCLGPSVLTLTRRHSNHDDVIKWKHFPRYWPFVRGIHRSPVNFPHKGQWRGALMFSLICTRINGWVNNAEVGDLRRYRVHYDVTVMGLQKQTDYIAHVQVDLDRLS